MRQHVLEKIGSWKTEKLYHAIGEFGNSENPLLSLFYEAVFLSDRFRKIRRGLKNDRQQGIHLQFQDLTSSMGVPCCKCFVIDNKNHIFKGSGANLNAAKALLSAMTETPFPFPAGPSSTPGLEGLIRVPIENLPDYSTGNTAGDLALLENVLASHGFHPIYVDLTRKDIDLPVVRAIVPSMEVVADFEWYSRAPPRLFYNY